MGKVMKAPEVAKLWIDQGNEVEAAYYAMDSLGDKVRYATHTTSDYVSMLAGIQSVATRKIREAVAYQRGEGVTWQQIGNSLGMTKQAAQQKFGYE